MKKILVTGVAGFIGSNLAKRLVVAKDATGAPLYRVVGIDDLAYGLKENIPPEIEFIAADIRSRDIYPLFEGVDVVFHLAAKNSLPDCQRDPVETIDINVLGTANVFEAARRAGEKQGGKAPKAVYAQSSAVEEGDDRARGFYAISKIAGQLVDEGYKKAFGLTTVGARYFQVYGPGQDYRRNPPPIMTKFILQMLRGEQPVLFDDEESNKRDFIFVDDVNDFHLMCIEDDRVNNKMFRIGSGTSVSLAEVFLTIKKILNSSIEPVIKPRPADPDFQPAITKADITDTLALGWKPKTSLEDGLRAQVEYLKAEFAKGNIK